MYYYPSLTPFDFQSLTWIVIQPAQNGSALQAENNQFCPSPNQQTNVQFSNQTKDPMSPKITGCQVNNLGQKKLKPILLNNNKKSIHKNQKDQDFNPNIHVIKKGRRTPQNANRNIIPNIMNQVISFIQKKTKSGEYVQKLFLREKVPQICSVKRFYHYQTLIKDNWNHYVNAESLIMLKKINVGLVQIFSQQEQRNYNKISFILINYFLTNQFETSILTSKRMNSERKLDHLKMKRKILQQISQLFSQRE